MEKSHMWSVMLALVALGLGLFTLLMANHRNENGSLYCLEGYVFIMNNGTYTQVVNPTGGGVACDPTDGSKWK